MDFSKTVQKICKSYSRSKVVRIFGNDVIPLQPLYSATDKIGKLQTRQSIQEWTK